MTLEHGLMNLDDYGVNFGISYELLVLLVGLSPTATGAAKPMDQEFVAKIPSLRSVSYR